MINSSDSETGKYLSGISFVRLEEYEADDRHFYYDMILPPAGDIFYTKLGEYVSGVYNAQNSDDEGTLVTFEVLQGGKWVDVYDDEPNPLTNKLSEDEIAAGKRKFKLTFLEKMDSYEYFWLGLDSGKDRESFCSDPFAVGNPINYDENPED
jgi:hypothetical protein